MKKQETKRKRKLKVGRILIALTILVIAIIGIYFLVTKLTDNARNNNDVIAGDKNKENEVKEETYKISMVTVGDNLIHSSIYNEANRNANYDGYDFKPMITMIKDKVQGYDLAYYNQETILGGSELGLSDYPTFNSPYEAGDAMLDAGFNMVSLATNHTIDRGEKAVLNSCEYWNSKTDVLTAGSYCSEEERNEVKVMEKNNITYTMLNYTYGTNGIAIPKGKDYLVNVWPMDYNADYGVGYEAFKETVKKDVERVRDKVDVLIVAMHWGVEYTHTPTKYQKDAAEFLASLGVDIVIGTHPHVVQPVEWIDDTIVFYSLGNFISAQDQKDNYNKMVGLMSSLDITKTVKGDDIDIKIDNINNELIYTRHIGYRQFKVIPFSEMDSTYLFNYEEIYNKYSEVVKMYDETMPVVALS